MWLVFEISEPRGLAWFEVAHMVAPIERARIFLSPVCLLQGSPVTWYSSVRRGSNLLRNSTLLVWPPVARTTPFLARIFTSLPSFCAVIPRTLPDEEVSLMIRVIL